MIFRALVLATFLRVANSQCSVCGEGNEVTITDAIFEFPGQPAVTCELLESVGEQGLIPNTQCALLPTFIDELCGCETIAPVGPTDPPNTAAPIAP